MNDTEGRAAIEGYLCQEMEILLAGLCTNDEDSGSIMNMEITDERMSRLVELALDEFQRRLPFLFRLMSVLTDSNQKEKNPWPLVCVYSLIVARYSRRFNVLQRIVTAACIRHSAGNAVSCHINYDNHIERGSILFFALYGQSQVLTTVTLNLNNNHATPPFTPMFHPSTVR